jgi:aspartate/tyrosine/aromatic aminotransferase
MSLFADIPHAPPDPILGLTEAYKADPDPHKVNLGVGVYVNNEGITPVLDCVAQAEQKLAREKGSKSYLPMQGLPDYTAHVQNLLLGELAETLRERSFTAQTPGGTGGLRIAGDFLATQMPNSILWMSDPTWPNHPKVFSAAGLTQKSYRYFNSGENCLDFEGMMADLQSIAVGDVVLLHASCHNPTGVDPSPEQWEQIAELIAARGALPLVDFAYQGFANGLREDAQGLRIILQKCPAVMISSSFSKNFGLYGERVGALTFVTASAEEAETVGSQVKITIRTSYSNPPIHGAAIVATVLGNEQLKSLWLEELAGMRDRVNSMRRMLVDGLRDAGVERDFSFLADQNGMFSYSGLSREQVRHLREDHHIYAVDSGRVNVAGITTHNVERVSSAIAQVLKRS